ncbi:hypothetical protein [Nostoc sp.]|uniref:hypothetical protein n=1 Tax=Nostoc sp. TaxID=1180 RepID=UPI002FF82372
MTANKKLQRQGDGVFGHGEWGMGHSEEVANAQCSMPNAPSGGAASLSTHSWDGVSRRFQ